MATKKKKLVAKRPSNWTPFTGKAVAKNTLSGVKKKKASKTASRTTNTKKVSKKVVEKEENTQTPQPRGKKALMAAKMAHMREIANINAKLGISKKKK